MLPCAARGAGVVQLALPRWSVERFGRLLRGRSGTRRQSAYTLRVSNKPPLRAVSSGDGAARRHALRIVVADDERDTATTLAIILRNEGHEVQTVLRGDDALELCRLFRPDVVIADIDLPGASGYAIARELHARNHQLVPLLIAVSGKWTSPADRLLGQAVGFDHHLLKPCDPEALLPLLEPLRRGTESGAA